MILNIGRLRRAGDTKAGTLIGTDRYGNKYYENMEELPRESVWRNWHMTVN
jgi:hypothetical protein